MDEGFDDCVEALGGMKGVFRGGVWIGYDSEAGLSFIMILGLEKRSTYHTIAWLLFYPYLEGSLILRTT